MLAEWVSRYRLSCRRDPTGYYSFN